MEMGREKLRDSGPAMDQGFGFAKRLRGRRELRAQQSRRATRRRGDTETRRRGDTETRRRGDMETRRSGRASVSRHSVSASPHRPFSASPRPRVYLSVPASPFLRISQSHRRRVPDSFFCSSMYRLLSRASHASSSCDAFSNSSLLSNPRRSASKNARVRTL